MSNVHQLENISSVCTTATELIKSEDFMRWIGIILRKVNKYDKEYISSLFTKLQNGETLEDNEKWDLTSFVQDEKVAEEWQKLLSKLSNSPNKVETKNQKETKAFAEFLEEILSENWYNKVQECIWEVAEISELTLNRYEWMDKVTMTLESWETKETHVQKEPLKLLDDSILTHTLANWTLSNFPGDEINENPLLITKDTNWYYHFWQIAGEQEAEKQWMRLPTEEEMISPEFRNYIVNNTTVFPGCRLRGGSGFWGRGYDLYLWSSATGGEDAGSLGFGKWGSSTCSYWLGKHFGLSLRCCKD